VYELIWVIDTGAQPLVNEDETLILAVNGEIYNHLALRKGLKNPAKFKTHSDCEVCVAELQQVKSMESTFRQFHDSSSIS
jgi:asparagine synthetase B (glutamine-hydrolysing)